MELCKNCTSGLIYSYLSQRHLNQGGDIWVNTCLCLLVENFVSLYGLFHLSVISVEAIRVSTYTNSPNTFTVAGVWFSVALVKINTFWFSALSALMLFVSSAKRLPNLRKFLQRAEQLDCETVLRLILVVSHSNQRNGPLAGPAANTDKARLAFTESTLQAIEGLSAGTQQNTHTHN